MVMSLVCIYCIIFILLSHGFIPGLSALRQSYPATTFSWPVEYCKKLWHPLFKKHPCLINASFPFTMLNLYWSVPLSDKHPLSNRRPHDNFSTNIPANNKKEHIKASCSMSNSNDNTTTKNEDSDNEVEIWNRDMDL